MKKILISACLLGSPVRYDGFGLTLESPLLKQWQSDGRVVSFCPEVAAGMAIPRAPAEIIGGDGLDVIHGKARVVDQNGENVTAYFLYGADMALAQCRAHHVQVALLTESSPSCGSRMIHDGRFMGRRTAGMGVTTALLKQQGILVFNQSEARAANAALESED